MQILVLTVKSVDTSQNFAATYITKNIKEIVNDSYLTKHQQILKSERWLFNKKPTAKKIQ